jgi:intein/homing endonuclease
MEAKLYKLSNGFAKHNNLLIYFSAVQLFETQKAVYLYGHGTTETTKLGVCCNCGRALTHPVSVELGIGPECGQHFHDWDRIGGYTKENIERLKGAMVDIVIDHWVPKSMIEGTFPTADTIVVPTDHPILLRNQPIAPTPVTTNEMKPIVNAPPPKPTKFASITDGSAQYSLSVIKVVFPFNFDDIDKVKTLSERRYVPSEKCWTCKLDLINAAKLKSWGFSLCKTLENMLGKSDAAYGGKNIISVDTVKSIEVPGLKEQLFPFQKVGVSFIEEKGGRALVADEMGLGKTVQALAWLQLHPELRPAVIVVPASLKLNWKREAEKWMTKPKCEILTGTTPYKTYGEIIIINYDILAKWVVKLRSLSPEVLIMDEIHCFPAGTKIETPNGKVNIEDLKIGDSIFNANGTGLIEAISKRKTKELIRLHLNNETHIDVTPEHPFFTGDGWCPAKDLLKINSKLFFISDFFNTFVRFKLLKKESNGKNEKEMSEVWKNIQNEFPKATLLWDILLSEMEDGSTEYKGDLENTGTQGKSKYDLEKISKRKSSVGRSLLKKNEGEQPSNESFSESKNKKALGDLSTSNLSTTTKRRQRKGNPQISEDFMGSIGKGMDFGISYTNERKTGINVPNKLQSRYSPYKEQNMDRSGWLESSNGRKDYVGSEKSKILEDIRVERIEVLESTDTRKSGECVVYNLQVSGHPSYFAGGVLVHNCIKNSSTKRTKAVKLLAKGIHHVIGLSGTPIVNRPIEAYNALTIINSAAIPNFKVFTNRYCAAKHNGFGWDFSGASNTDELHKLLVHAFMIRRKKTDVLKDLPDKIKAFVPMELSNQSIYDNAESDFIQYLQQTKGMAAAERASNAKALAEIEGLKQLAVAGKMDQAVDWIEEFFETDQKLVVFAVHKSVIDTLMDKFGKIAVKVDGSVSMAIRQESVDKFQNDPKCRLFIGNIQAAGVGLTLTGASNVAFIELPWTPGALVQAEDRCHRIGQKDSVTIHYLLAAGTIEEKIALLLDSKRKILDAILDGEKTAQTSLLTELMKGYL